MKSTALTGLLTAAVLIPLTAGAQPRPGNPTTATVITKAEIDKIAATMQNVTTRDENARVVDIGDGWSMELGIIHRAKQRVLTVGEARAQAARGNAPAAAGRGNAQAAEQRAPCGQQMANPPDDALQGAITHDFQTEGYYIVSGGGTMFTDGYIVNGRHNPSPDLNGPTCGGQAVDVVKKTVKAGDIIIIPAGVVHGWVDIPEHVDYLSFRPSPGILTAGFVHPVLRK